MNSTDYRDKYDYISYKKVLLFGDESTGKSSLAQRLAKGKFQENITHSNEGKTIIN
jgi:GTPase SAR1 family protein